MDEDVDALVLRLTEATPDELSEKVDEHILSHLPDEDKEEWYAENDREYLNNDTFESYVR